MEGCPNSKNYKLLTVLILFLSIIQLPLFYYYTFGIFSFFIVVPYLLFSVIITGLLLSPIGIGMKISNFHKYGTFAAIFIGITTLSFGLDNMENLDWKFRLKDREAIVERALKGAFKDNRVKLNYFPPISNGGNEVFIDKGPNGSLTVTFYIDRGFLDHYAAFIYTTDSSKIRAFDARIQSVQRETNKKIKDNWYRIAE